MKLAAQRGRQRQAERAIGLALRVEEEPARADFSGEARARIVGEEHRVHLGGGNALQKKFKIEDSPDRIFADWTNHARGDSRCRGRGRTATLRRWPMPTSISSSFPSFKSTSPRRQDAMTRT